MVCKEFFCSEFPVFPEKWWRKVEPGRLLRSVLLFNQTLTVNYELIVSFNNKNWKQNTTFVSKSFSKFLSLSKLIFYIKKNRKAFASKFSSLIQIFIIEMAN